MIVKRVIACLAIGIFLAGCASGPLRSKAAVKPSGTSSSGTPQTAPSCCIPSTTISRSPPTNTSAQLSVSSTLLTVGESMTITGSNCPAGQWVGISLKTRSLLLGPFAFYEGGPQPVPVGADGHWSSTSTVPMLPGGPTTLTAHCGPEASAPTAWLFAYPSVPVTVTTPFQLSVLPSTTVSPGTTLTVTPGGGGCPPPSTWIQLTLYATSQPPTEPQIEVAQGVVNITGLSADQTVDWRGLSRAVIAGPGSVSTRSRLCVLPRCTQRLLCADRHHGEMTSWNLAHHRVALADKAEWQPFPA